MSILKRRITKADSIPTIVDAIIKVASDKNSHVLKDDCIDWLEIKMKEITRLGRLLKKKAAEAAGG